MTAAPEGGDAVVRSTPEEIWSILDDPVALGRVLPGCESVEAVGPDRFRLVLSTHLGAMQISADVDASYHDADRPSHLRLEMVGVPRGFGGSFSASIPLDLEPTAAGATRVRYDVAVTTSGAVSFVGAGAIRDAVHAMVAALVVNLERELSTT